MTTYVKRLPDIALVSEDIVKDIINWRVMEHYIDHYYTSYNVTRDQPIRLNPASSGRWNVANFNEEVVVFAITQKKDVVVEYTESAEAIANTSMTLISRVWDASML